jgi:hypothetical protein
MSTCRSCGADVIFGRNAEGRTEILDARPSADGNRVFAQGLVRAAQATDIQLGRALYRSHFATCPQSSEWRRR